MCDVNKGFYRFDGPDKTGGSRTVDEWIGDFTSIKLIIHRKKISVIAPYSV